MPQSNHPHGIVSWVYLLRFGYFSRSRKTWKKGIFQSNEEICLNKQKQEKVEWNEELWCICKQETK